LCGKPDIHVSGVSTMKSSWIVVVSALLLAPFVLAITAFFSGLWQDTTEPPLISEEELGI